MPDENKQKYEKPEIDGLGDENGKLSPEDLENISGGERWYCNTGGNVDNQTDCALGSNPSGNCCGLGGDATDQCHQGHSANNECATGGSKGPW